MTKRKQQGKGRDMQVMMLIIAAMPAAAAYS